MNIFYLPDYNTTFQNELFIMNTLASQNDAVITSQANYKRTKNIINICVDTISRINKIDKIEKGLIVGVGIGAYFGYYTSNLTDSPSLLFNPIFFSKNGCELKSKIIIDLKGKYFKNRIFILDQSIDVKNTLKYLTNIGYDDSSIKIYEKLNQDIYRLEIESFKKKCQEKFDSLKNQLQNTPDVNVLFQTFPMKGSHGIIYSDITYQNGQFQVER